MATKGPSFRYGNTNGSNHRGMKTSSIGFAWAKDFNKWGIKKHFVEHGKEFGAISIDDYVAKAIHFANTINRRNYRSVKDYNDTTYKYDTRNGTLVEVAKDGYIISYRHIGNKLWYFPRKGVKNG